MIKLPNGCNAISPRIRRASNRVHNNRHNSARNNRIHSNRRNSARSNPNSNQETSFRQRAMSAAFAPSRFATITTNRVLFLPVSISAQRRLIVSISTQLAVNRRRFRNIIRPSAAVCCVEPQLSKTEEIR